VQRPVAHVPEQQSASSRQPRPDVRHVQLPDTQSMYPQQSPPPLQLPDAS